MTTYVHPDIYNPSEKVDLIVADCDQIVLFDSYSSDFTTIQSNAIYSYTPTVTKVADEGGFDAVVQAETNQTEDTNTGVFNHYALLDTVNSKVLAVGNGGGGTITAGQPFNTPEFIINMPAPVAV